MDNNNNNKKKSTKQKYIIDDDCITCSACNSKLVKVSDVTRIPLNTLNVGGKGETLSCSVCGSDLRLLNGFVN
nr:zinc finger-like protein [Wadden Sea poxvirus]